MTREIVRPAWAWVCDGCRRVDDRLAYTQDGLSKPATMRRHGWQISPGTPVRDLCPECVAKEVSDG